MNQDMIKKLSEATFPFLLTMVFLGYLIYAMWLGSPINQGKPSPLFFPTVIAVVGLCLSALTTYRSIRAFREARGEAATEKLAVIRPMLIVAMTIVYIALFPRVGYVVSSLIYLFAIISIFSNLKRPIFSILGSVVITLMGLVLFEYIFRIRLPGFPG